MIEIILPVRKVFSDKIFSGEKKFEYRKAIPLDRVSKIYIYESRGSGTIVGEIEVDEVLSEEPEKLWQLTKDAAGIDHASFRQYFNGRAMAHAFPVKSYLKYERAKSLSEFGLSSAPQNFVKIKGGQPR